jgi:fermentation-respiration switch protein FrsA (DUF1100 family)
MKRIVRLAVLFYLGFVGLLFSLQTRMIFPGHGSQGQPYAEVRPGLGCKLVRLKTRRGESVAALFGPALTSDGQPDPGAAGRPTLIYFYGNAMCLNDADSEFEQFRRLGLNVLIPDFVGFGMSSGSPSETGCYATADAAYDYLVSTCGVKPDRIVAGGWSLGGAVAVDLAAHQEVGGLIIFSTFTSVTDMARRLLPLVPVSLLLRHRFDSLGKIDRVRCPILIAHGRRDRIAPFPMAPRLATAAKSPVTTLWIDEADHNDFYAVGGRRIDEAVVRFIREYLP